jgi:intermediate peptidase
VPPSIARQHFSYSIYSQAANRVAAFSDKTSCEPDDALRLIFDDRETWLRARRRTSAQTSTGLFRNADLATPQGFKVAAEKTLRRVKLVVHRISTANSESELRKVVKNLDRTSDALCSVIDLAEFVRTAHPDQKFVQAANWAYEHLCSYMNTLNTNTNLYQVSLRCTCVHIESALFLPPSSGLDRHDLVRGSRKELIVTLSPYLPRY